MKRFFLAAVVLLLAVQAEAEVKLPALLGSNMVLQRNTEVNFWGEASPRSRVLLTASWDGRTYDAKADAEGRWAMKIATGEAGGPYTVTVSDGKEVVLDNVMLGEVWVCSGQSNMEMPVSGFMFQPVEGAVDAIADAGMYPGIRMFTVPRVSSKTPLDDCDAAWQTATPASVGQFSAVGYFFGRMLYKALGIPVGLITSNWGGSTIEAWMTVDAIDATPGIDHAVAKSGTYDNSIPQRLYNGMILPVCRYTAKGFIWYQGESNRKNWYDYKALQVSLVKLWRETWGDGKMPFYYTQLAPYRYEGDTLRSLPLVIEAQYRALAEIPHSGIAATTDLGNPTCIHPARKREVGERLAFLALANDYGVTGLPAPAPVYKSMERDGNKLVLTFDNLPVRAQNGVDSFVAFGPEGYCRPGGFEIAGEDRVFHPAVANFKYWDNRIEVSRPGARPGGGALRLPQLLPRSQCHDDDGAAPSRSAPTTGRWTTSVGSGKHPAAMHPEFPLPADFRVLPLFAGIAPLSCACIADGIGRPPGGVMSSGRGSGLRRVRAVPRRIMPSASEPDGAFLLPEIGIMAPCICIY
ncbi:MAG: sialate O-acetylesterase [Alistipes onderdonkii]